MKRHLPFIIAIGLVFTVAVFADHQKDLSSAAESLRVAAERLAKVSHGVDGVNAVETGAHDLVNESKRFHAELAQQKFSPAKLRARFDLMRNRYVLLRFQFHQHFKWTNEAMRDAWDDVSFEVVNASRILSSPPVVVAPKPKPPVTVGRNVIVTGRIESSAFTFNVKSRQQLERDIVSFHKTKKITEAVDDIYVNINGKPVAGRVDGKLDPRQKAGHLRNESGYWRTAEAVREQIAAAVYVGGTTTVVGSKPAPVVKPPVKPAEPLWVSMSQPIMRDGTDQLPGISDRPVYGLRLIVLDAERSYVRIGKVTVTMSDGKKIEATFSDKVYRGRWVDLGSFDQPRKVKSVEVYIHHKGNVVLQGKTAK